MQDDLQALRKLTPPVRNNYFYGKLLDESSFCLEQRYGNNQRRLMNRLGFGAGVMCGLRLGVTADGALFLTPGVAIDPLGREIIVSTTTPIDPRTATTDCGKPGEAIASGVVTIGLAYHLCATDPVPVLVSDCDTVEGCAPGTLREGFAVIVRKGAPTAVDATCPVPGLFAAPAGGGVADPNVVSSGIVAWLEQDCAAPSKPEWVVLGQVTIPDDRPNLLITDLAPAGRHAVPSTSELLQLLLCLWERVEQGFAAIAPAPGPAPPGQAPGPGPAPVAGGQAPVASPFQITDVRFLNKAGQVIGQVKDPAQAVTLPRGTLASIRVQFSNAVNPQSLTTTAAGGDPRGASVLLTSDADASDFVPGKVGLLNNDPKTVELVVDPKAAPLARGGIFRLTLSGTSNPNGRPGIADVSNQSLDGDPVKIPSGSGHPGTDFVTRVAFQ